MNKFEQAPTGKPVWIDPDAVILAEGDTIASTRLVLINGGAVCVLGTPEVVLEKLGLSA